MEAPLEFSKLEFNKEVFESATPYKVIVVEDEERILKNIVRKINQVNAGFKVVGEAKSGKEALVFIDEAVPDVVFTDVKMPVMDGLELLEIVHDRYPYVKTVIISGYADFEYAQKAIAYGVVGYLLKPVEIEELRKLLDKLRIMLDHERETLKAKFSLPSELRTAEDVVVRLKQFLRENYAENINLNFLMEGIGYSVAYISKLFARKVGVSPYHYLIALRIGRAKYLLKNWKDLSIKQVAEMVGYPDQCYFSRIFKKITGKSPKEFREEALL